MLSLPNQGVEDGAAGQPLPAWGKTQRRGGSLSRQGSLSAAPDQARGGPTAGDDDGCSDASGLDPAPQPSAAPLKQEQELECLPAGPSLQLTVPGLALSLPHGLDLLPVTPPPAASGNSTPATAAAAAAAAAVLTAPQEQQQQQPPQLPAPVPAGGPEQPSEPKGEPAAAAAMGAGCTSAAALPEAAQPALAAAALAPAGAGAGTGGHLPPGLHHLTRHWLPEGARGEAVLRQLGAADLKQADHMIK